MQNMFKSPIKHTVKSVAHSTYNSKPKSKNSGVSASKREFQIKREVFNNQVYKTILSRVLSKNSLEEFLEETSKFIILTDQISRPHQKSHYYTKSSQQFPQLGRAMLKDGSFIKHYCKLLIMKEPLRQEEFKKYFFERYKNQICEKKSYFETFFKVQIKEESNTLSQSQRKMSSKKEFVQFSWKKSFKSSKKKMAESNLKHLKTQAPQENIENSPKFFEETSNTIETCSVSTYIEPKNQKIQPTSSLVNLEEQNSQSMKASTYSYRSISKKQNQTEEQRQRRLMSLMDQTVKSKKSERNGGTIIRFVDQLQSNKRLKDIYESVKKEREAIKSAEGSNPKNVSLQKSPIIRQSYIKMHQNWQKLKFHLLTSDIISKMTPEERKLLDYFPKITKYAFSTQIKKDIPISLGHFAQKLLVKCFITDFLQYLQPSYIAIYLEELDSSASMVHGFDEQQDETVEVILIQQFGQ